MIIVRAPVRISFGGGGTDLPAYYQRHVGYVISAAITRYCYVILRERKDGGLYFSSADYHESKNYPRGVTPLVEPPLALPAAAATWFLQHGGLPSGAELFLASEVPPGTGLGSSSAMAVALAHALSAFCGCSLASQDAAELACTFELDLLKMPIGKQDQYASAFGGVNCIEFRGQCVHVMPLMLSQERLATLSASLLLFATGLTHNSSEILRSEQSALQQADNLKIERLTRMKELAYDMRDALLIGDFDSFGQLLDQSWQEKRRLSTRISSTAIDQYYTAAREAGAIGGKITGAGGGGFLLLYCPPERQEAVRAAMKQVGLAELPFDIDMAGPSVTVHAVATAGRTA
jgi:D-glycero-alpha-D-manno-heptose-7-phosphate kinase